MLLHIDMDAFYASVELQDHPELKGKPVVVGGGRRGVVSAASYEARAYGLHSAMPMYEAKRRCPGLVVLPVRMERYQEVSRQVMDIVHEFTPLVEQVSVDEAYLDLTGSQGLWGPPLEAARLLKARIWEQTSLTCSVGIAPLRFLCKIASERQKPDGLTLVDDVEAFVQTVSLKEVPGVGKKAQAKLAEFGLTRLAEVRVMKPEMLISIFGVFGQRLWDLAWGRDPEGVHPDREIKSVSQETTFAENISDRQVLAGYLLDLSEKTGHRLRRHGLYGRTITLKLRHADFALHTRSKSLPQAINHTKAIYDNALELLNNYNHRGPFRLIGVGVSSLSAEPPPQGLLFQQENQGKISALNQAEDAICRRFGAQALKRAASLPLYPSGWGDKSAPDREE